MMELRSNCLPTTVNAFNAHDGPPTNAHNGPLTPPTVDSSNAHDDPPTTPPTVNASNAHDGSPISSTVNTSNIFDGPPATASTSSPVVSVDNVLPFTSFTTTHSIPLINVTGDHNEVS